MRRLAVAGLACGLLSACSPSMGGELGQMQAMAGDCPQAGKPATFVSVDVSETMRSTDIAASQLGIVRMMAEQTAVCSGRLRVSAFSSSSAATVTLYDGELAPPGATEQARLRRIPDLVAEVMQQVEPALREASNQLPGGGTDVLAQLDNAAEYAHQVGSAYVLDAVFVTDGVATTGTITNAANFDLAAAQDLATRVPVPDLTGGTVLFAGIGRAAGPPPPSVYVEALKRFYTDACTRTRPRSCRVVTDFAMPGSPS